MSLDLLFCTENVQLEEDLEENIKEEPQNDSYESNSSVPTYFDPILLENPKIIQNLLIFEKDFIHRTKKYFEKNNKDILPYMRKVVSIWMLEVCEEQCCESAVFPLAISILDQFLGSNRIHSTQLQLIACVSLLLASKTRQESHFSLQLLSWYTENSVSLNSLMNWELTILSELNWDINLITAVDFLDFLIFQFEKESENDILRKTTLTFINLCYTEPRFVGVKPSLIASASIYTSLKSFEGTNAISQNSLKNSIEKMSAETKISIPDIVSTSNIICQFMSKELTNMSQTHTLHLPRVSEITKTRPCSTTGQNPLTPTDIQDILC